MARRHRVEEPNEVSEAWREYRRAQQQRRGDRLGPRVEEIEALRGKGFTVQRMSDYQFRIDGALDLYPIHRRYHHFESRKRGDYKNPLTVAVRFIRGGRP